MTLEELKDEFVSGELTLKSVFMKGDAEREALLDRCEEYAGWTLPRLLPREVSYDTEELQNDYQSLGAQAVTNLSNKIVTTLFQPSKPFFKLELTADQTNEIAGETGLTKAQITEALSKVEREGMKDLVKMDVRVASIEAAQHIIVTGNALVFAPSGSATQVYSLRDYVIKRNLRGELIRIIIKETKTVSGLSRELAVLAEAEGYSDDDEISIYTAIQAVDGDKFLVWQELEDLCFCHKKLGVYAKNTLPWIPLVWSLARGRDYGTGLVEEYAGDFSKLSDLSRADTEFLVAATDIKTLVNPTGMTDVREITEAESGSYVYGREEDLHTHTADVSNVVDSIEARIDRVERRLAAAFLLTNRVTRDAERVTAEEIRQQAYELESSYGGVYSRLARDLQLPLANILLKKAGKVFEGMEPIIVTGFESLSRTSDLDNFRRFMSDLAQLSELPDQAQRRIDFGNVIAVLGAGHGVDYSTFLKDEKVVQAEQKAELDAMAQQKGAEEQAVQQAQQQQG